MIDLAIPAPRSYLTGVPGWETPAEQDLLVRLARTVPEQGVIVELGAEYGMSASLFAHGARQTVKIVSIDLFPGDLLMGHRSNLAKAGIQGRTRQVQMNSHGPNINMFDVWVRAFQEEPKQPPKIDLLFIDADHSYAGCKADIETWMPHVHIGGRVAFHDTAAPTNPLPHPLHHEVSRAIADWLAAEGNHWQLIEQVDSIQVYERTA